MKRLKMSFKTKHLFLAGAALLSIILLGSGPVFAEPDETYYPTSNAYREARSLWDTDPCGIFDDSNEYGNIYIGFPDIGNYDRKVTSAKLYLTANYSPVAGALQQQEYATAGSCDTNLFGKAYIARTGYLGYPVLEKYLPDVQEVSYDVPLSNFDCDYENRSYTQRVVYYKTTIVNQMVQLGGARLEIIFGGSCPQDPPPPPPAPQGFNATPEINEVSLNWNTVQEASEYNIYWSNQPGVTKTNFDGKIAGLTGTAYTHTEEAPGIPLQFNTTYYYVVTAQNMSGGESADSAVVQVKLDAPPIVPIISLILY